MFFFYTALFIFFGFTTFKALFGKKIRGQSRFDSYLLISLSLWMACGYPVVTQLTREYRLSLATRALTGIPNARINCNNHPSGLFRLNSSTGYVYRDKPVAYMEPEHCDNLAEYQRDPSQYNANKHLWSLHVLTHEAMHIAGEFNEKKTDCMAFQRNHLMAQHLGASPTLAAQHARYLHRTRKGFSGHPHYYSNQCEPGLKLDERLPGAVWIGAEHPAAKTMEQTAQQEWQQMWQARRQSRRGNDDVNY